LSVGSQDALGDALDPGDRVTVLATFTTSSGGDVTRALAQSLLVLAVGAPPAIGDPASETVPVTLALPDPAIASQLALANTAAHIDLMRDGATPPPVPTATVPGATT
jgi:Flp pilus assembly protein CpaB